MQARRERYQSIALLCHRHLYTALVWPPVCALCKMPFTGVFLLAYLHFLGLHGRQWSERIPGRDGKHRSTRPPWTRWKERTTRCQWERWWSRCFRFSGVYQLLSASKKCCWWITKQVIIETCNHFNFKGRLTQIFMIFLICWLNHGN